jgi:CrcB protein
MVQSLIVGMGGFLGAILRYALGGLAQRWAGDAFPLGTLAVNLLGCLLIGACMYLVEYRLLMGPNLRVFLIIGVLGGFTTFSAFGYESFVLLRDGAYWAALLNMAANVIGGTAAVLVGWMAAKATGV